MAMIYDVPTRQANQFGNTDAFYPHPPVTLSGTAPHNPYYRQHSPPTTHANLQPPPPNGNSPPSYRFVNHEMEFLGNSEYRMYPPSPPTHPNSLPPAASVAAVPSLPQQYGYAPGYGRPPPQDILQPIDSVTRLPLLTHQGIAQQQFSRLPSPFSATTSGNNNPVPTRRPEPLPGIRKQTKRSHSCMVCGKVFARPSALQTHLYSHTGEKPFKCDQAGCGRSFSVVSNLRRHARVHKDS